MTRSPLFAVIVAALAACGPAAPPPQNVDDSIELLSDVGGPAYESPARWAYHPEESMQLFDQLKLSDGRCVMVGEAGRRWLVGPPDGDASAGSQCSGPATAASIIAPENLVGVMRRSDSAWVFVGESGSLYEADGPLAPFQRRLRSPRPFRKVSGRGATLLAITADGSLFRWDARTSWVEVPQAAGQIIDLALDANGKALLLSIPEAIYLTEDGGKTLRPVTTDSATSKPGIRRVGLTENGTLGAEGLTATFTLKDGKLVPGRQALRVTAEPTELVIGPSRSALALEKHTAALSGDQYYALVRSEEEDDYDGKAGWLLHRGTLDGALTTTLVKDLEECDGVRVGAHNRRLAVACFVDDGESVVRVLTSDTGGDRFEEVVRLRNYNIDEVAVAVSPDGRVLMSGVCETGKEECDPRAPVLLVPRTAARAKAANAKRASKPKPKATASADTTPSPNPSEKKPAVVAADRAKVEVITGSAPHALDPARLIAFSPSGDITYFISQRSKDKRLAIFRSDDGGRSYSHRALQVPRQVQIDLIGTPEGRGDEGDEPYDITQDLSLESDSWLCVDEDGTLGLGLWSPESRLYFGADSDGRVTRVSAPPTRDANLGGCGSKLLALGYGDEPDSHNDRIRAWESLDGGVGWAEMPTTLALESTNEDTIVCATGGCLVHDVVSRVGWGGQLEPFGQLATTESRGPAQVELRTPMLCELSADEPWLSISNVDSDSVLGFPNGSDIMRGDATWSVITRDPTTMAVSTRFATAAGARSKNKVAQKQLLKSRRAGDAALEVSHQLEGYAAIRAEVSADRVVKSAEIAWENYMDGTSGHTTISDRAVLSGAQFEGKGQLLKVGLVSVSPGGVFVGPLEASASRKVMFVSADEQKRVFDYPSWTALGVKLPLRSEAVAVGGQLFPVGVTSGLGGVVGVMANNRSGSWTLAPELVMPEASPDSSHSYLSWTYQGNRVGMISIITSPKTGQAWAQFHAFGEDGTIARGVALPTPYDVGTKISSCSSEAIATTPRVVAPMFETARAKGPMFPGTRHPVVIFEGMTQTGTSLVGATAEPIVLLTADMVLHGTTEAPCVAGWAAEGVRNGPFGAVIPGDLRQSAWAFRAGPRSTTDARIIEARPMSCKLEPTLTVPDIVMAEPGTIMVGP